MLYIPLSSIDILNDDVLFNIFYLYRLDFPDEYDEDGLPNFDWGGQRWWYNWIFIFYAPTRVVTRETSEEDILLALRHSDRVHYISLYLPSPKLRKIITIMDEQFPLLERMHIESRVEDDTGSLVLPRTFQASHLHHLGLRPAALPIGSPLLLTTTLEILMIEFHSPLPKRDVESQLLNSPIMTHITLPNLRWFSFEGVSAYLEGLVVRISTPVLSELKIQFFNQPTFIVPRLLQVMETSEILSFSTVWLVFGPGRFTLRRHYQGTWTSSPFYLEVLCRHLDWQVSSATQILNTLQPALSVAEKLTLSHLPLELLPNLKELGYSDGDYARDPFTPFIDERQLAGHPVNLTIVDHSEFSP
ncbi:hypothetical protein BJV78DRAFT_1282736 [Lactifluus subvellereus]|nr:hypothetical protein BJV78DRAFT_1282736 [Lactifluus subvellereus]